MNLTLFFLLLTYFYAFQKQRNACAVYFFDVLTVNVHFFLCLSTGREQVV